MIKVPVLPPSPGRLLISDDMMHLETLIYPTVIPLNEIPYPGSVLYSSDTVFEGKSIRKLLSQSFVLPPNSVELGTPSPYCEKI